MPLETVWNGPGKLGPAMGEGQEEQAYWRHMQTLRHRAMVKRCAFLFASATKVWEHGGFSADFRGQEDKFQHQIASNPSTLHVFLHACLFELCYEAVRQRLRTRNLASG